MKTILSYIPEGIILSLLNLAALPFGNNRDDYGFYLEFNSEYLDWYLVLFVISLIFTFIITQIKKIKGKKKWFIIGIYPFIPVLIDYCFRNGNDYIAFGNLIWIFLITILAWILLRYEIDETIKDTLPKQE